MPDELISKRRFDEIRRLARRQELLILVWGPGDPGRDGPPEHLKYREKRVKIRESLQGVYRDSEIRFSEDLDLREHTEDLNDILTEELLHSSAADCILILDTSRGAHVEIDRFSDLPHIAEKTTALIPDRFVNTPGLVGEIYKRVKIMGFSEEEFTSCTLATSKTISAVDAYAIQLLLKGTLPRFM